AAWASSRGERPRCRSETWARVWVRRLGLFRRWLPSIMTTTLDGPRDAAASSPWRPRNIWLTKRHKMAVLGPFSARRRRGEGDPARVHDVAEEGDGPLGVEVHVGRAAQVPARRVAELEAARAA